MARDGHAQCLSLPSVREVPLVPFGLDPFLVCEIKRKSPSKGDIAPGIDAVGRAAAYLERGARNLSVLTEQDGFGGSLEDLLRIKRAFQVPPFYGRISSSTRRTWTSPGARARTRCC